MKRNNTAKKRDRLISKIKTFESLVVAFSGGVDSSLLLAVAHEILGDRVVAVTAESPVHPGKEKKAAEKFAGQLGVRHIFLESREMSFTDFTANTRERCYVCKKHLLEDIKQIADTLGIDHIAHGANLDDLKDFRPGFKAAEEMGIISPLIDAEMTKSDIRFLAREMNLGVWDKPSMACLASRIPYGTPITDKALQMVEEAESIILGLGVSGCRVRHHDTVARIEVSTGDFDRIMTKENRIFIVEQLREIGFSHISIDLEGYVQGSMNIQPEFIEKA